MWVRLERNINNYKYLEKGFFQLFRNRIALKMLWIKQVNSPPSWETCTRISEANRDDFMEGGSIRFRLPTISIHLVNLPTISNQFSDNFRFFRHDLCHTYQRGFETGREEFTPWVIMITRYSQTMDWKPMFWVHIACQFLWQSIRPWWCFVYLSELLSDSVVPDPSWTPYSLTCGSPELHFPVKKYTGIKFVAHLHA